MLTFSSVLSVKDMSMPTLLTEKVEPWHMRFTLLATEVRINLQSRTKGLGQMFPIPRDRNTALAANDNARSPTPPPNNVEPV